MAWLEATLRFFGFAVCHTLPSRTLVFGGHYLPVCSRCTGIYLGVALTYVYLVVRRGFRVNALPPLAASLAVAAMLLPMAVDGVSSYAGLRETNNTLRFLTGIVAGGALPIFAFPLLSAELVVAAGKKKAIRPFERWFDYLLWLGLLAAAAALVFAGWPALYYPLAVVSILGLLAIFLNLALTIWEMALERARWARRPWTVLLAALTVLLLFTLLNIFHRFTLKAMLAATGGVLPT